MLRKLVIILIFLTLGYTLGYTIGNLQKSKSQGGREDSIYQEITPEGQINVLIFGIDHFAENATLEGVWLAAYFPNKPQLTLIPLYPLPPSTPRKEDFLPSRFSLNPNGEPDERFIKELVEKKNLLIHGYLVIEEIAVIKVVDQLGGVVIDGATMDGLQTLDHLLKSAQSAEKAYFAQQRLFAALCKRSTQVDLSHIDVDPLFRLYPNHIKTNLNFHKLASDYIRLASKENAQCQFPMEEIAGRLNH